MKTFDLILLFQSLPKVNIKSTLYNTEIFFTLCDISYQVRMLLSIVELLAVLDFKENFLCFAFSLILLL